MKTLLVVIYTCLAIFLGYDALTAEEYTYRNESVYVYAGDTMWDIAGEHVQPGEDIRDVVARISEANNLPKGVLYPGRVIKVPVRVQANSDYQVAQKGQ